MIKKANIITVIILVLLGISCKKEIVTVATLPTKIDSLKAPNPKKYDCKEFDKLVTAFSNRKQQIKQQLTSATPKEADSLFDLYLEENGVAIGAIENGEEHLLNNYDTYFYDGEDKINPPDSIQHKISLLDKAGLEFWGVGEGMVAIRTVPDFYQKLFGSHVTEDYEAFIALYAEEDKVLFVNDAAIIIPLEDLGRRIIAWENFIAKYPDSKIIGKAKSNYQYYQYFYLLGMDNTPVFNSETNTIIHENLEDFRKFCTKYPTSPTTKLVHIVLTAKGDSPQLHNTIIKEQKNMGLDTKLYE